jgi:Flp pilus assembly pilin Flp
MPFPQLRTTATWLAATLPVRLRRDEAGASLVEYALLLALIVVVAIGVVVIIGNVTSNTINNAANQFPQ